MTTARPFIFSDRWPRLRRFLPANLGRGFCISGGSPVVVVNGDESFLIVFGSPQWSSMPFLITFRAIFKALILTGRFGSVMGRNRSNATFRAFGFPMTNGT